MSDAVDGEMTKLPKLRAQAGGGDRHGTDHHNRVGSSVTGRRVRSYGSNSKRREQGLCWKCREEGPTHLGLAG